MQFSRGLGVFKEYSYLLNNKHLEYSVIVGLWGDFNLGDYTSLGGGYDCCPCAAAKSVWQSSANDERHVWSSLAGWEMCEGVWRTAMGLERRWLQAVTAALAICLLSKYANAAQTIAYIYNAFP